MSETKTEAKRVRFATSTIDGAVCRTKFHVDGDEKIREDRVDDLAPKTLHNLALYGLSAAGKASYHGEADNAQQAYDLFSAFIASLHDGTWEPGRAGEAGPSELVQAIMRAEQTAHGKNPAVVLHTVEQVREVVDPLTPAEKRALRADPEIAKAIADIQMEKAREAQRVARGKKSDESALGQLFGLRKAAPAA